MLILETGLKVPIVIEDKYPLTVTDIFPDKAVITYRGEILALPFNAIIQLAPEIKITCRPRTSTTVSLGFDAPRRITINRLRVHRRARK